MIDSHFLELAARHFNPYQPSSGTEHVAFLLYALARMTRPKTIIEYGSGYTTLFLLRALADNLRDSRSEHGRLLEKSRRLLAKLPSPPTLEESPAWLMSDDDEPSHLQDWLFSGGQACAVDPEFYREAYEPRLYSFDQLGPEHEYAQNLIASVRAVEHEDIFSYVHGGFSLAALPERSRSIDWAWNDDADYRGFFKEIWPHLNPAGGLVIFHNVPACRLWTEAVEWMKRERAAANDLETLIVEEPHKLNQNGCAILRKVSGCRPRHALASPARLWGSAAELVNGEV